MGGGQARGEIRNIGAGGLLFSTELDCRKAERLKVIIDLPDNLEGASTAATARQLDAPDRTVSVTAVCEVLRSNKLYDERFEIAARFITVPKEDMAILKRFVDTELKRLAQHRTLTPAPVPVT
jgi:hypothetical protein